jgi:hypothetical protein
LTTIWKRRIAAAEATPATQSGNLVTLRERSSRAEPFKRDMAEWRQRNQAEDFGLET